MTGLDKKLDEALAGKDALATFRDGIEEILRLLPQIAEDVNATREGVARIESELGEVRRLIEQAPNAPALSAQEKDSLVAELASARGDHKALVAVVQGFLQAVTQSNVPADQFVATLFSLAAEWREAGARIDALGHSRNLTPRVAELRKQALAAHAAGDVEGARIALEGIDAEELAAEERLARHAQEIEEEWKARRAERVRTKEAQISVARSGLRATDTARHIAEKIDLEVEDSTQRFATLNAAWTDFYERGRDKGVNFDLEVAIELARLASNVSRDPDQRAAVQNALGVALVDLGERESGTALLQEAVVTYRALLSEHTRERVPLNWALTLTNLGAALWALGKRESGTARLEEAVVAFRAALEEYTRERVPLDWAMTQNNLGAALQTLGERESGTARLEDAVVAYRAALEERTRERVPVDWMMTQNNLGNALRRLGERESGTALLEEAVVAYRLAQELRPRERFPREWARTQTNLGGALVTLGARESGTARLEEAVAAFRAALEGRTRESIPIDWAIIRENMAVAYLSLFYKTGHEVHRTDALAALDEALVVYREAKAEYFIDNAEKSRAHILAAIPDTP